MMEVYAIAGGLALAAIGWVVRSARRPAATGPDGGDVSAAVYLDRERELVTEARGQGLAGAEVDTLQAELAANLATEIGAGGGDSQGLADAAEPPAKPPLLPITLGAVLAGVVSLALYAEWGEPDARRLGEVVTLLESPSPAAAELAAAEASLARRAARNPADGNALFHQGHARFRMGDYAAAAAIFKTLHERMGATPAVDAAWAQARYMAAGGRMAPATRAIIERVLDAEPGHLAMLELLATDALRRGDLPAARQHLARATANLGAGGPTGAARAALALARERSAAAPAVPGPPPTAPPGTPPSAPPGPPPTAPPAPPATAPPAEPAAITASVSLAPAFEVAADTPVFVIVRQAGAAGPPLAVRRLTAGELPAQVTLTDADAMLPGRPLPLKESVQVLARVSLSGGPVRRAGDLESPAATARLGSAPVRLHVKRIVR